jgi:hypothetical protein
MINLGKVSYVLVVKNFLIASVLNKLSNPSVSILCILPDKTKSIADRIELLPDSLSPTMH